MCSRSWCGGRCYSGARIERGTDKERKEVLKKRKKCGIAIRSQWKHQGPKKRAVECWLHNFVSFFEVRFQILWVLNPRHSDQVVRPRTTVNFTAIFFGRDTSCIPKLPYTHSFGSFLSLDLSLVSPLSLILIPKRLWFETQFIRVTAGYDLHCTFINLEYNDVTLLF